MVSRYIDIEYVVPRGLVLLNTQGSQQETRQCRDITSTCLSFARLDDGPISSRLFVTDFRSAKKTDRIGMARHLATRRCRQTIMKVGCMSADDRGLVEGIAFYWVRYTQRVIDGVNQESFARLIIAGRSQAVVAYDENTADLTPTILNVQFGETGYRIADACARLTFQLERLYGDYLLERSLQLKERPKFPWPAIPRSKPIAQP